MKGDLDRIRESLGERMHWSSGGPSWLQSSSAATILLDAAKDPEEAGPPAELSPKDRGSAQVASGRFSRGGAARCFLCWLFRGRAFRTRYQPIRWLAAVERKLSLLLSETARHLAMSSRRSVRSYHPGDRANRGGRFVQRRARFPDGKFSLPGLTSPFQSAATTLSGESQLSDFRSRIVAALTSKLGASLRAG